VGTDWPHANFEDTMPQDADLVDLIQEIARTDEERQKLLVVNPPGCTTSSESREATPYCLRSKLSWLGDSSSPSRAPLSRGAHHQKRGEMKLEFWLAATILVIAPGLAPAQSYPTKPIRLVVGFVPGGAATSRRASSRAA